MNVQSNTEFIQNPNISLICVTDLICSVAPSVDVEKVANDNSLHRNYRQSCAKYLNIVQNLLALSAA